MSQKIPTMNNSATDLPIKKKKTSSEIILWLWKYLHNDSPRLLIITFLLLISSASTIASSYLLRPIINDYIIPGNIPGLIKMTAILFGVYLTGAVTVILQNRIMINVAQGVIANLRNDLFEKLQSLPVQFFDSKSHGDLMSRFTNDVDTISEFLNTSVTQFITSLLTLVGVFFMMIFISPLLTLFTLIMVTLMLFVASFIVKKSKKYFTMQQAAIGVVNGYAEEMITGQKTVKVFGYENIAAQNFDDLNDNLKSKAEKAQLYSGIMMPVMQNLNTINFAITATLGGIFAIVRGLDIGGLAAFLQYSRQFGRPVNEISSQYNSLQSALAGAERIFQIFAQPTETYHDTNKIETLPNLKGDVQLSNVSFAYNPPKTILQDISIHAPSGKNIALVGTTGAGKTTIMNLLPRFYDIQSGNITIDGINITSIKRSTLRSTMAIVLQETHLFSGSIMDNIRYGRLEATDEEIINTAQLTGAHVFITRFPDGYQTKLKNDGQSLSQGERQLINITRAAVAQSQILILDEATSSIDTRTEQIIQKGINQLLAARTSFVIAHRLSTLENADEILVLDKGSILERGNHKTLLEQKGIYFELYRAQFE